jgi:hypothetical protein
VIGHRNPYGSIKPTLIGSRSYRKPLLDYLQGKMNSTDAIQPVLKPAIEEYHPEDPGLFNKSPRIEADGNGSLENYINT